ncbi:uncharacterized protein LOC127699861 isoform X2 [Mytilus californianus]|uniref:uncharacterized protein LOC127699861 isoform X2 n=1 Tax=Mytilus californianus TaxID=6549 RepID=UPI002246E3E4|nr:uncharacterized protein LOC127699861 isoform X2 [Mytilus californianus]
MKSLRKRFGNQKGKKCESCETTDDIKAVSWCSDCRIYVCKTCSKFHERMRQAHKVIPMETIHQVSPSLLQLPKNCEHHPDKNMVLFCCQHDEIICDSCQLEIHQKCTPINSLEKAASGVNEGTAMIRLEKRMNDLSKISKTMLNQKKEKLKDLKKSQNDFKQRVSGTKQKLIDRLNKLESEIFTDIDFKYGQCFETVSITEGSLEDCSSSLSTWKADLSSLKPNTSEIHLFQSVKLLEEITNEKECEIRKIERADVPTITFMPSELESNMEKLLADLGTIRVEEFPVPVPELNANHEGQSLVNDTENLHLNTLDLIY